MQGKPSDSANIDVVNGTLLRLSALPVQYQRGLKGNEAAMTHEEQRELQVLSDAKGCPELRRYYSFKDDPELAATARRLGRKPVPHMIEISERPMPGGLAVYLMGIHESGRARERELQTKLAAEQINIFSSGG